MSGRHENKTFVGNKKRINMIENNMSKMLTKLSSESGLDSSGGHLQ